MSKPHSPLAIANEFINRSNGELTQMQLQKLVYLAHGWMLGATDRPLISEQVEAWQFGPVIRSLYDALKKYGSSSVTKPLKWGDDTPFSLDQGEVAKEPLRPDEDFIIAMVWEKYGHMPAFKLSALTHEEGTPWSMSYEPQKNRPISNETIRDHFRQLLTEAKVA